MLFRSKKLKYKDLYKFLYEKITSGAYSPGDTIPTERELANQFGVSRPTVSRALKELENTGFIERRERSGTFVKPLVSRAFQSARIGYFAPTFLLYDGAQSAFDPFPTFLSSAANRYSSSVVLANTGYSGPLPPDEVAKLVFWQCENLIKTGIDAVVFMPLDMAGLPEDANENIIKLFEDADVTIVLVDRDIVTLPQRSHLDLVRINHHSAAYLATEHLIKLGCKDISFVTYGNKSSAVQQRIFGFHNALLRHDLSATPTDLIKLNTRNPDEVRQTLRNLKCEALVCINDTVAAHVIQQMHQLKIRIPEQIRIVSFDNLPLSQYLFPPLTSIDQPMDKIATLCIDRIFKRLTDPDSPIVEIQLDAELVVRESCGSKLKK